MIIRASKEILPNRRDVLKMLVGGYTLSQIGEAAGYPDYTFAVLPDTQYMARDCTSIFNKVMNQIITDKTTYNIKIVIGVGDCLHTPSASSNSESSVVITAYGLLDTAGIPFIAAIGNHDYITVGLPDRTALGWHFKNGNYFSAPNRKAVYSTGLPIGNGDMAYWVGSYDAYSGSTPTQDSTNSGVAMAVRLRIGKRKVVILTLPYFADSPTLLWAKTIHDTYSAQGYEVLIATHGFLRTDPTDTLPCKRADTWGPNANGGMAAAPYSNSGLEMWRGTFPSDTNDPSDATWPGLKTLSNLLGSFCGHWIDPLVGSTFYTGSGNRYFNYIPITNTAGNTHHAILCNLQERDNNSGTPAADASCTAVTSTFGDDRGHVLYVTYSPLFNTVKAKLLSANTNLYATSATIPVSNIPYCTSVSPVDLLSVAHKGVPNVFPGSLSIG